MRLRRLSSLVAGTLLAPLFVIVPLDLSAAKPTPQPVSGTESTAKMVDSSHEEVADAALAPATEIAKATRDNARERLGAQTLPNQGVSVLKATTPQDVNPSLAAVGITWEKGTGVGSQVQYRALKGDAWGEWTNVTVDTSSGPDESAAGSVTRVGSELIMLSGASKVQARVLGGPAQVPVDPEVTVIDPGVSEADKAPEQQPAGAAHAAVVRPQILSRAQWGADETWRTGRPMSNTVKGVIIHHTADTNNYTRDQVPGMMRSMYRYATKTLGWDDIAYNYVIDRWGRIWQGRAWLYPEQPVFPAAHLSNNDRAMGVSMLGNYESEVLSTPARKSLERIIGWAATQYGFDPSGRMLIYNNKTAREEWMPTITGHRDNYFTACPGANLYPLIPSIRANVRKLVAGSGGAVTPPPAPRVPAGALDRDVDGMNDSDILGRDASGRLTLASPTGKGQMTPMELYGGSGWNTMDVVTIGGDWTGDARPDVIARKSSTAELFLYPSTTAGKLSSGRRIGTGWNGMQTIVAPGDWNGDGTPDIIATHRTTGDMYFYAGDNRGGFATSGRKIGHGWGGIKSIAAVGDWNGDKKPDLAAVTYSGVGVIYYGDGKGGFTAQDTQSGNWGAYASLTGVSDAYGDGKNNLVAVTGDGTVFLGSRASNTSTSFQRVNTSYRGYAVYSG